MASKMGEVITIENFQAKMPKISPVDTGKPLYGLVDMGSNGIRFSITDLDPSISRLLRCIYRERAGISLYDALHESTPDAKPFHFSPKTITNVADTLARFQSICDNYQVPKQNILVFATEAMRTAKNRDEMLEAIGRRSGLTVEILSPPMESLFGAMGARSGYEHVDGLFMDLGGGSVQMTYVDSESVADYYTLAAQAATSMPYGAAKLTAALNEVKTADATKKDLKSSMKDTFEALKGKYPRLQEQTEGKNSSGVTIYLCGGGFRGYGSMLMHTDPVTLYPIPIIGGYTVSGHRFKQWEEMIKANAHDGKIYGMSKRRREQFPAIVTVIRALIDAVPNISKVIFCSGGNREGVLYMRLPPNVRESNPLMTLPGGVSSMSDETETCIIDLLTRSVPKRVPGAEKLPRSLFLYLAKHMYMHMGRDDAANSAKSLHRPIAGSLSSVPGLTHQMRALFALTMCARWGTDLGPVDRGLHDGLCRVVGPELNLLCNYIGTVAKLLATILPAVPVSATQVSETTRLQSSWSHDHGKKGNKPGIRLLVDLKKGVDQGIEKGSLDDMFSKVGKGVELDWKIQAIIGSI